MSDSMLKKSQRKTHARASRLMYRQTASAMSAFSFRVPLAVPVLVDHAFFGLALAKPVAHNPNFRLALAKPVAHNPNFRFALAKPVAHNSNFRFALAKPVAHNPNFQR